MPVIHPHAAGIDIGSRQTFVCVPSDSCAEPIGTFGMFTDDLARLATWLKECKVRTVCVESTGVCWIPLYQTLEAQGFEVMLVNPNYPKKKKTDIADCQWLQFLHSVGLLSASFRPPQQVCAIREIIRHRGNHVKAAASHIQRMQKSLTQMNLLLHNVITDITGVTGLAIIDAIIAGERDPVELAKHRNKGIKASYEDVVRSLAGDYRPEHLFTLKQSRTAFSFCQEQMAECDAQIAMMLAQFDSQVDCSLHPIPKDRPNRSNIRKNEIDLPGGDLRQEMYRINGVDLTQIPGIKATSVNALISEIGTDLCAFESAGHFASWLGLCPNNRVSGGKVMSSKTRKVKSRAATTLRVSAQALASSQSYLGEFYRRMRYRMGPAAANTATAHKLARIIYHLITTKEPYNESVFSKAQARFQEKKIRRLQKEAQILGYTLAPV
jgi:transposase